MIDAHLSEFAGTPAQRVAAAIAAGVVNLHTSGTVVFDAPPPDLPDYMSVIGDNMSLSQWHKAYHGGSLLRWYGNQGSYSGGARNLSLINLAPGGYGIWLCAGPWGAPHALRFERINITGSAPWDIPLLANGAQIAPSNGLHGIRTVTLDHVDCFGGLAAGMQLINCVNWTILGGGCYPGGVGSSYGGDLLLQGYQGLPSHRSQVNMILGHNAQGRVLMVEADSNIYVGNAGVVTISATAANNTVIVPPAVGEAAGNASPSSSINGVLGGVT